MRLVFSYAGCDDGRVDEADQLPFDRRDESEVPHQRSDFLHRALPKASWHLDRRISAETASKIQAPAKGKVVDKMHRGASKVQTVPEKNALKCDMLVRGMSGSFLTSRI